MTKLSPDSIQWLIEMLRARQMVGLERYGKPLTPLDGRNNLQDALEEALDLAAYLAKEKLEREAINAENERLRALLLAGVATHGEACRERETCEFMRDARAALNSDKRALK